MASNYEALRSCAARLRRERRTVLQSLIGASAPLGYTKTGPARLWEETLLYDGPLEKCQSTLGNVAIWYLNAEDDVLVGGLDDAADRQKTPLGGRTS